MWDVPGADGGLQVALVCRAVSPWVWCGDVRSCVQCCEPFPALLTHSFLVSTQPACKSLHTLLILQPSTVLTDSVCLSVDLSICQYVCLFRCRSFYIYLSVFLYSCLFICFFSVCLSFCLYICLFIRLFSVALFGYLSVNLSINVSVSFFFRKSFNGLDNKHYTITLLCTFPKHCKTMFDNTVKQ